MILPFTSNFSTSMVNMHGCVIRSVHKISYITVTYPLRILHYWLYPQEITVTQNTNTNVTAESFWSSGTLSINAWWTAYNIENAFTSVSETGDLGIEMQVQLTEGFKAMTSSLILGLVVQMPVSSNPGLNFNPGFFLFSSKALSWITFYILFRVSNH